MEIIDEEGLDALSIRRLGERLGVNGASLYHHFANKEAIIAGAAELALAEVRTPPEQATETWREWLPRNARRLRDALLAHPELVPVIVRRHAIGMGAQMLNTSAARLIEEGVPSGAVMPLLDALEFFAIGSALHQIKGEGPEDRIGDLAGGYPMLAKVIAERGLSSDEIFDLVNRSILNAIDEAVKERQARWMPAVPDMTAVPAAPEPRPDTPATIALAAALTAAEGQPKPVRQRRRATKSTTE